MVDFAARNNIYCMTEKFPMTLEGVTAVLEKLEVGKMRCCGVLA